MMMTGMSLDAVLAMDMLTFNALMPALTRERLRNEIQAMRYASIAHNAGMSGNSKQIDELEDSVARAFGEAKPKLSGKGMKSAGDFLKDMGMGRKGGRI